MELISTSFHMDFSYLFLCYLAPLLLILASGVWSFKTRHKNLPPGSFGWPLIGETIAFGKPEKFVLDRMNKYSPDIFKTKILGEEIAVICGPNGHKFLFTNEYKIFTPFLPCSMRKLFLSSAPGSYKLKEDIKSTRAAPGFLKPEALVKYVGKMDSITQQQMLTLWEGKDEVKAFSLAKSLTLTLACRFFMGTEDPERVARAVNRFDCIKVGMHSVPFNFPGTNFHKACKAAAAVHKELRSVISEKKAAIERGEPMQDIVSHMILATDESGKRMPEIAIADKLLGLLVAGYSNVASVMTFFMKYVGERPDIYQKVLAEQQEIAASKKPGELLEWDDMQNMKYTWKVLCEVMRITPTIQGTFREVLTDFTYAGYTVPKGWKLYWSVNSTNKNPKYFPDPQNFDPSRFDETNKLPPFTFTPFGAGPRICPAKEYSRLAILTFVHNVVKRFKWELVLPEEKIRGDMMPSPEQGLPIRLYSH